MASKSTQDPADLESAIKASPVLDEKTSLPDLEKSESAAADSSKEGARSSTEKPGFWRRKRQQLDPFRLANPPRTKDSLDDADLIPETTANFFSNLTFNWITPILVLGYNRPLEATDLWRLQEDRSAKVVGDKILDSWNARKAKADAYNARLANGEISPGWRSLWWTVRGKRSEREQKWREVDGKRKPSLVWSMNDSVKWWFWSAGILKVIGDTSQITSPLVIKALINFATQSFQAGPTDAAPPIGLGVGYAFILFAMQIIASVCVHHTFYRSMSTGVLIRGGLITAIYSKSMKLTSKARSTLTNGKLVNHISTDVSRIDFCAAYFHLAWAAPVQICICLALLIINLGPSALAGFGFLVLITPLQTYGMKSMFTLRRKNMIWTDKRAKLLQELLGGMKIIKFFGWETPFLKRIFDIRKSEMKYIKYLLMFRSANNAVAMSVPVLAAILAFVTYSLSGHELNAASIFASLTLFNLLRLPLLMLPMALSSITDATNAIQRLSLVFEAEEFTDHIDQDDSQEAALIVKDAEFAWDSPPIDLPDEIKSKKRFKRNKTAPIKPPVTPVTPWYDDTPFKIYPTSFEVQRGQLVAIVGPVGVGKSSLLQGLIGEMKRTSGTVTFGGSLSYCPQIAWIQNSTIRDNILFGQPFDEERYWKAVEASCLNLDLDMLPNGDMTEVGERGISLSGGQKQRINICRVIYRNADIEIFDDPLSALDAHVGKKVFEDAIRHNPDNKTRILVTHALHFLPQCDYILTIVDGRVIERGTFHDLMASNGGFARFYAEFESTEDEEDKEKLKAESEAEVLEDKAGEKRKKMVAGAGIMQTEERNTGAIRGSVYKRYMAAGRGALIVPWMLLSLVLLQATQVMSSYWLVYWQTDHFHQSQGFYMGIYGGLGVFQAVASFGMGAVFSLLTYYASQTLHANAIKRVMHAPMSFFDTTPLGRIMNRFSKDIDTVDSLLGDSIRMFANTLSTIIGAIILIAIVLPYFLIAVLFVAASYVYAGVFYRESAREIKRLDAILRSSVYSHFSESLSGLPTIRAYRETNQFVRENEERVDIENRAYLLTTVNQRWLGLRIDMLGSTLTFVVAILTVATRFSISPAQTGVVLSYILSIQQTFGWMVRQSAELENNMNSVERVVHYAEGVEQEAAYEIPATAPDHKSWPSAGAVEFKDVVFKYRPELPTVLKGLTMKVNGGEKIGIVGRTGAGKSSIMSALFRIVELTGGSVAIDGIDLSTLGLKDVRQCVSIIPQDPLLFSGTIRSNLDPFGVYDDSRLWDAMKRSYLAEDRKLSLESATPGASTPSGQNRLTLDSPVEDEGNNLSIGQRSLVSLARALVRDSKVLVLDEATASVDYETDRKIQLTIAEEFKDRTILCIAHRLRTIISYDRICVMDAGRVVEYDDPETLYHNKNGIFHGMCVRSSIALEDIRLARKIKEAGSH